MYNNTSDISFAGGVAGLTLCLFAKLQNYIADRRQRRRVIEQVD